MLNETNGNYLYGRPEPKTLYIDIETYPPLAYIWGPLYKPFTNHNMVKEEGGILCWQGQWKGSKEILFHAVWDYPNEKEFLKELWKTLDKADVVVHFNGKRFDMPTIHTQFTKHRIGPHSPVHQTDLYQIIRSTFRHPSNRLAYLCNFFELKDKKKESGGDRTFIDAHEGCPKARKKLEKYGKADIPPMVAIHRIIEPWIRTPFNLSTYHGELICPRCGSSSEKHKKNGTKPTATGHKQQYRCGSCKGFFVSPRVGTPTYFKPVT